MYWCKYCTNALHRAPSNATRRSWWNQFDPIQVWTKRTNWHIVYEVKFLHDLRMNSVSHNSLLQGLRLLNRHMLQTTQLVINSVRELTLLHAACFWMENMFRSLWEAYIDLIPCQNEFSPRLCLPNVGTSGASGFYQQCLPVTEATYPLRNTWVGTHGLWIFGMEDLPLASPPIHL